jgi:hypothetical protein
MGYLLPEAGIIPYKVDQASSLTYDVHPIVGAGSKPALFAMQVIILPIGFFLDSLKYLKFGNTEMRAE